MMDHHQAEITVMQFTGHSLPVHQSMSVPWEFFTSSLFISQFPPTRFSLITATRMCHLLPVHHLGMAFLAGSKVKIQQLNKEQTNKTSLLAQSVGAPEYTDCNSAERSDPPPPAMSVLDYDTKQSDGQALVVQELWGMRSTPSLPLLPGPLCPVVVAPDRALSMGLRELTAYLC